LLTLTVDILHASHEMALAFRGFSSSHRLKHQNGLNVLKEHVLKHS